MQLYSFPASLEAQSIKRYCACVSNFSSITTEGTGFQGPRMQQTVVSDDGVKERETSHLKGHPMHMIVLSIRSTYSLREGRKFIVILSLSLSRAIRGDRWTTTSSLRSGYSSDPQIERMHFLPRVGSNTAIPYHLHPFLSFPSHVCKTQRRYV